MDKPPVAVLGLGTMGSGVANRLIAESFPVMVYNRHKEKCIPFIRAGALGAPTPCQAARSAKYVLSMVSDEEASRSIWLGPDGALEGVRPGTVLIECSTLTVDWVSALDGLSRKCDCEFLDAPVTGTKTHASSGELKFLVGAATSALERARPILSALGSAVTHVGPVGSGTFLKLINNLLLAVEIAAFADALTLIKRKGLDLQMTRDFILNGAASSTILKRVAERLDSADFTPLFSVELMHKDLRYVIQESTRLGFISASSHTALTFFANAIELGLGKQDIAASVHSCLRS